MSKRDAYVERLQAQMDEWSAELHKLKARADRATAESKIDYYEQIEKLKQKQQHAQEKLAELRQAGEHAWEDMKKGLESAWASFGEALKSAGSRFG